MGDLIERLLAYADAWDDNGNTPDIVATLREAATALQEADRG